LDQIARYLESIEGSAQRQVLIEARIIEVTLTAEYRFGLDWGAIARAGALRGATTVSPMRIIGQKLAPSGGQFQVGVTSTDFESLLSVLSQQGEVNVLSTPKLATLNNQTAVIRSATDEVFFETRVVTIPTGNTVVQTSEVTPRTVTIGVVLSVTPQISSDGTVILHIRPAVTDSTRRETFRQAGTEITVPVVDVREADVIARAKEGQIVVIGGLIQERKTDDESKVPLLGDLPGIGRLFRSTTQERKKTELVVLLSPTVLVGKKVDEVTSRELESLNKTKGRSPW
jgi:MSHA type pilus biogenesis protein MshL